MNTITKLDIITRTRGEVMSNREPTGENLFLAWGYPTAFFLLVEFVALMLWNENWCAWLWLGIPVVGTPLMMYFLNEDYDRTHRFTLDQNIILLMWIYVGFACCLGCGAMGFAGIFEQCGMMLIGLLCGFGCFMTGVILHFRPKTVCGIIGSVLSFVPLFFQGNLWHWQLLVTALVAVMTLIIPGHMFHHYVKEQIKL